MHSSHNDIDPVNMNYSSKLLEAAVKSFSTLPGIGKKTALRLALFLLKRDKEDVATFAESIASFRNNIKHCNKCYNLSDLELCEVCSNSSRKQDLICVVENVRDVLAIEETEQFNGLYHVLGGIISPLDGIGPEDLFIAPLVERVKTGEIKEVIMAVSPTIEGETTIYYLSKLLAEYDIQISTIARGVSFGGELEYADEFTLGRSIRARLPYQAQNAAEKASPSK